MRIVLYGDRHTAAGVARRTFEQEVKVMGAGTRSVLRVLQIVISLRLDTDFLDPGILR